MYIANDDIALETTRKEDLIFWYTSDILPSDIFAGGCRDGLPCCYCLVGTSGHTTVLIQTEHILVKVPKGKKTEISGLVCTSCFVPTLPDPDLGGLDSNLQ